MIIKSIKLTNFQCYSGNNNYFEFKEGLNVIIGDNSAGKSKLYDAFTWALFDECFETESSKTKTTSVFRSHLISDKAKHLAAIGEKITTEVSLVFYRKVNNKDEEISVKRTYSIVKKAAMEWDAPHHSELEISKKDLSLQQVTKVQGDPKDYINENLLPLDIRPYTWFQGEQVNNLIDFENKMALTKAINVLSDISEYKYYVEFATQALKEVQNEVISEASRAGKAKKALDKLVGTRQTDEERIERLQNDLLEAEKNWAYAHKRVNELLGQVENATKISGLQQKLSDIQHRVTTKEKILDTLKMQFHKHLFTKYWILRNVSSLTDEYAQKFEAYQQTKLQQIADKKALEKFTTQFEGNITQTFLENLIQADPNLAYFNQMLEQEHCLVCDRHAPTESEPWMAIKKMLDRASTKTVQQLSQPMPLNQDFQPVFYQLHKTGLRLQGKAADIDDVIQLELSTKQDLIEDIKLEKIKAKNTSDAIEHLVSGSNITIENSLNIGRDYTDFTKKLSTFAQIKEQKQTELKNAKKVLEKTISEIADITKGKTPLFLQEKVKLLTDFKDITESTEKRVFENLIRTLEAKANTHFLSMTAGNQGVKGRIQLVKKEGYYMPQNVDAKGNELANINASNIILIKMAVLLAIISAKEDSNATQLYTLITDAPSSTFGENYTLGFCKTVSQVYKQSIIMSKDFLANKILQDGLLNSKQVPKLGNVYLIQPSITESDRSDRNTLSTNIQKMN
jgi:DNA sulfur modification protein DndD